MSTWYDAYWPALKRVIATAWPDILPGQLFADVNLERRDWTNLLDSQQIVGPWCVVSIAVANSEDGPANYLTYDVTPTVYYIAPHAQGITAQIIQRLTDLAQAVLTTADDMGTPKMRSFSVSVDAQNEVNKALLSADQAFQAGSLTFTSIVVQI